MRSVAVAVMALLLGGCATVTRGVENAVTINYYPADAQVGTSFGASCTASPCTFKVARRQEFTVTATRPGYIPATVQVQTRIATAGAAGMAGNVILGGVVGAGVDVVSGATLEHFPNPIDIRLVPEDPDNPATPPPPPLPPALPELAPGGQDDLSDGAFEPTS
jgi:hypothetical protein